MAACDHGIDFYWGGNWKSTESMAWGDSAKTSGSQVAELRGSFLATETANHEFELFSETYSTSGAYTVSTRFWLDDGDRGSGSRIWFAPIGLTKEFRYKIQLKTTDNFMWVQISIGVNFGVNRYSQIPADHLCTAFSIGCRDDNFQRSPYACMAPPTAAASASQSRGFSGTASQAFPNHRQAPFSLSGVARFRRPS